MTTPKGRPRGSKKRKLTEIDMALDSALVVGGLFTAVSALASIMSSPNAAETLGEAILYARKEIMKGKNDEQ